MDRDALLTAPALQLAFMALCIALLVVVYSMPFLDLRSLRRLAMRRRAEADRSGQEGQSGHWPVPDLLDRPDLGALLNLLVIVGTGLAMLVGWRVPAEIERIYGGGASFGLLFPNVEMTMLGRAAQVVGTVCLGLIALRLLRILVYFAAAALAGLGGFAAVEYVFDLDLFRLF